jgi:hypothetical protein
LFSFGDFKKSVEKAASPVINEAAKVVKDNGNEIKKIAEEVFNTIEDFAKKQLHG